MTAVLKTAGLRPTGVRIPHPGRTVRPYKHRTPPASHSIPRVAGRLATRQSGGRCRRTPGGESAAAAQGPPRGAGPIGPAAAVRRSPGGLEGRPSVPCTTPNRPPRTAPPIGGTISGCTVPGTILSRPLPETVPSDTVPPRIVPPRHRASGHRAAHRRHHTRRRSGGAVPTGHCRRSPPPDRPAMPCLPLQAPCRRSKTPFPADGRPAAHLPARPWPGGSKPPPLPGPAAEPQRRLYRADTLDGTDRGCPV